VGVRLGEILIYERGIWGAPRPSEQMGGVITKRRRNRVGAQIYVIEVDESGIADMLASALENGRPRPRRIDSKFIRNKTLVGTWRVDLPYGSHFDSPTLIKARAEKLVEVIKTVGYFVRYGGPQE
jgi:hypothetical protein